MQKPDARAAIAWCSPPPGWKACSTSPRRIPSIARSEPPPTAAAASCIPSNGGLSPGPIPASASSQPAVEALSENRFTTAR